MVSTILVGLVFFAIVGWGAYKSRQSMKNNSCPGCSASCSSEQKANCHH